MTGVEFGELPATWQDVVKAVQTLMKTFTPELEAQGLFPARDKIEELVASLEQVEIHKRRQSTYALVAFAAMTIHWASTALDRDAHEVLAEIAQGVGVDLHQG
jgi:hypothetical protein